MNLQSAAFAIRRRADLRQSYPTFLAIFFNSVITRDRSLKQLKGTDLAAASPHRFSGFSP